MVKFEMAFPVKGQTQSDDRDPLLLSSCAYESRVCRAWRLPLMQPLPS